MLNEMGGIMYLFYKGKAGFLMSISELVYLLKVYLFDSVVLCVWL